VVDGTNRGLQCLFGSVPPVHAYFLDDIDALDQTPALRPPEAVVAEADADGDRVGTAIICELPPLPGEEEQSWIPGQNERQLMPGSPHSVCVEVTLNAKRSQASRKCVQFTYYDT
jgi:hypothetical protein